MIQNEGYPIPVCDDDCEKKHHRHKHHKEDHHECECEPEYITPVPFARPSPYAAGGNLFFTILIIAIIFLLKRRIPLAV